MMKLTSKTAIQATLSAVLLLGAAAPTQAQGLVSAGNGKYPAFSEPITLHFTYFLMDKGNDKADGLAIWRGPNSITLWRITSWGFFEFTPGKRSLAFAGKVVAIIGDPPPGASVGATAFTAMNDEPDGTSSLSFVPPASALPPLPPQFGDLSTIQQIVGFLALLNAPPPVFQPLQQGNIWIR
jgi:hypothetical protein